MTLETVLDKGFQCFYSIYVRPVFPTLLLLHDESRVCQACGVEMICGACVRSPEDFPFGSANHEFTITKSGKTEY